MKTKNILIIIGVLTFALSYSSCKKMIVLNGNHHEMTETRKLVPFTKVDNEENFNVYIIQDTITEVIVQAESNLIPSIRTIVNGNTLIIDSRETLNPNIAINIYVKTPSIDGIKLSGSGNMTADSLMGDNVDISISGSGNISANVEAGMLNMNISGSGDMLVNAICQASYTKISGSGDITLSGSSIDGDFNISGSGKIHSYDFFQQTLDATISGSGNMYVNVAEQMKVRISGSGSVYYIGTPSLDISISGSGSVINQ